MTHDGSMYAIYGNMDPINIPPFMLAILWVINHGFKMVPTSLLFHSSGEKPRLRAQNHVGRHASMILETPIGTIPGATSRSVVGLPSNESSTIWGSFYICCGSHGGSHLVFFRSQAFAWTASCRVSSKLPWLCLGHEDGDGDVTSSIYIVKHVTFIGTLSIYIIIYIYTNVNDNIHKW